MTPVLGAGEIAQSVTKSTGFSYRGLRFCKLTHIHLRLSFREPEALFWLLWLLHAHGEHIRRQMHKHIKTNRNKFKKKKKKRKKPAMVVYACNSSTQVAEAERSRVKSNLNYSGSLRQPGCLRLSQKQKTETEVKNSPCPLHSELKEGQIHSVGFIPLLCQHEKCGKAWEPCMLQCLRA